MANTTIAIKKSSTPSAEPTNLANGELAINFADGKLFYKNVSGQIVSFTSGSNSFGTVNANGTLIVADTTGDILTLEAGNNITITADAINDKITISSTGGGGSNVTVAKSQIKDLTSNDYVVTNVATIATVVDSSVAIAAFAKANNALANSTGTFSGNLTITGTLSVGTNTSQVTVGNVSISNSDIKINGTSVTTGAVYIPNLSLAVSAASNNLTISVKTDTDANASVSSPISVKFRSSNTASGILDSVVLTSSLSMSLTSGSTVGTLNNTPFRLWIVMFNDSGTLRLGVINCVTGTNIFSLDDYTVQTSTAEGGAGAADSAQIIYTSTAVTSKAFRILGYIESSSTSFTAGSWGTSGTGVITNVNLFGPSTPKPGQPTGNIVQVRKVDTFTTSSTSFTDITGMSVSLTPKSAANLVRISGTVNHATDTGGNAATLTLLRGLTNIAGGTAAGTRPSAIMGVVRTTDNNSQGCGTFNFLDYPMSTSSTTWKLQVIVQSLGTYYFNRTYSDTDAVYIGRYSSSITAEEIMG